MKMNNRYTEALKVISNSIKCLYAATAAEGIEISKQSLPDYIFLNVNMPGESVKTAAITIFLCGAI